MTHRQRGVNGGSERPNRSRPGRSAANSGLGAWGECLVAAALLRRGLRVYREFTGTRHPDFVAVWADDTMRTVEARVEWRTESLDPGDRRYGKVYRQRCRKAGDRCDHYAWVCRDTSVVTFDPELPAESGRRTVLDAEAP